MVRSSWILPAVLVLPVLALGQTSGGKSVRYWADKLASKNPGERRDAAYALTTLGKGAKAAVPELANALRTDPEAYVRLCAAEALGKAGVLTDQVTAALLRAATGDKSVDVRREAGEALVRLTEPELPKGRGAKLIAKLFARDAELRRNGIRELSALRPAPAWAKALLTALAADSDAGVRRAALEALGLNGEEIVLRGDLGDPNPDIRRAAALALGKRKGFDKETVEALRAVLKKDNLVELRALALDALAAGGDSEGDVLESLQHVYVLLRRRAALALGRQKSLSPAAADALANSWKWDKDPGVRQAALGALISAGDSRRAKATLREALKDPAAQFRVFAVTELARRYADDPAVSQDLRAALKEDQDVGVRGAALRCLAGRGHEEEVAAARMALADPHARLRETAAGILGTVKDLGPAEVEALRAVMRGDDNSQVRSMALAALTIASAGPTRQSVLLEGLKNTDAGLRRTAARELGQDKEAVATAALLAALRADTDLAVREAVLVSLRGRGADGGIEAALVDALQAKASGIRVFAAQELGRRQPLSATATKALVAALRSDGHAWVREETLTALALAGTPEAQAFIRVGLKDKTARNRMLAVQGLRRCKDLSGETAAALLTVAANDPDPLVRTEALLALGGLPQPPDGTAAALESAAAGKDSALRAAARLARARLKGAEVMNQAAATLARSAEGREKDYFLYALSRLGKEGVPVLQALFKDGEADDRLAVVLALASHDPPGKEGLPILMDALKEGGGQPPFEVPLTRMVAMVGLARLGSEARPAAPLLRKFAVNRGTPEQGLAMAAVSRLSGESRMELKYLDASDTAIVLSFERFWVALTASRIEPDRAAKWWQFSGAGWRQWLDACAKGGQQSPKFQEAILLGLVYAVGQMGPAAAEAAPSLEALLDHPNPFIRSRAAWALQRIR